MSSEKNFGLSEEQTKAVKNLILRMADDELIIGHRNSEWTGLGPILEEDIAFSSMAQDKLGHAQALYNILHTMGEPDADTIAFTRNEKNFYCCHLVEYPIGDYDFSIMRHFLFDTAEAVRFDMLTRSSFQPLANLAKKMRGELKYHTMHANIWINQLGKGTDESHIRMQKALDECFPLALGIFEPSDYENVLSESGIFDGEKLLQSVWMDITAEVMEKSNLKLPDLDSVTPSYGGRKGFHTEHLQPLLDEMTEVYATDPTAEW
ncbi:MAG: phenylacetate-CoA oxygenase subunit PaaC [Bacteroidetes bacterium]|nr:phenylacetate-CoA oxygenase subunit PaaC [Bacteroidota bacterium]